MIVLFTGGEELDHETLEDFVSEAPDVLKDIIKKAGNRYMVFNR